MGKFNCEHYNMVEMGTDHCRTIFISAAEASADKHAAKLVRRLRQDLPEIACDGLGGPLMAESGCEILENLVDRSAMLTHALGQVGFYYRLLGRLKRYFREHRPELVIVIDSPAWNFHVAKAANSMGIPVLYYVVPQLWAWGSWRTAKLRRCADRLACILPFEQQWFGEKGIQSEYVGHPLFDEENPVGAAAATDDDDSHGFPTVALLPGSRDHEIKRLWPTMQKVAWKVKEAFPLARFITATNRDSTADWLGRNSDPRLDIDVRLTGIEAVTRHADLAMVASGTATLEVAAQYCPMIVMYPVNRLQWHLVGRWIVKTKYICLVNILAEKEIVPEFIHSSSQTRAIAQEALLLLQDKEKLYQMRESLKELIEPIIQPGASENVVAIVKQMLPKY